MQTVTEGLSAERKTMELNINSPSGIETDSEVSRFCKQAYMFFKDKQYSDTVDIVGIVPFLANGDNNIKEGIKYLSGGSCVSVILLIDCNSYKNASSAERVNIIKDAVIKSVRKIKSSCKFDCNAFERDLKIV